LLHQNIFVSVRIHHILHWEVRCDAVVTKTPREHLLFGVFNELLDVVCHTSRKIKDFFAQNFKTVLHWPGTSPDFSKLRIDGQSSRFVCVRKTARRKSTIWGHNRDLVQEPLSHKQLQKSLSILLRQNVSLRRGRTRKEIIPNKNAHFKNLSCQ